MFIPKKSVLKVTLFTIGILFLVVLLWGVFFPFPSQKSQQLRAMVWVECKYIYYMTSGNDTIYFKKTDSLPEISLSASKLKQSSKGGGFWYGPIPLLHCCQGKLITTASVAFPDSQLVEFNKQLPEWLVLLDSIWADRLEDYKHGTSHLTYYLNTHSIGDEGYNHIARYANLHQEEKSETEKLLDILQRMLHSDSIGINCRVDCFVYQIDKNGRIADEALSCRRVSVNEGMVLLQTHSESMPSDAVSIASPLLNSLKLFPKDHHCSGYGIGFHCGANQDSIYASVIRGKIWMDAQTDEIKTSIPMLTSATGGFVVDVNGVLVGLIDKNRILPF